MKIWIQSGSGLATDATTPYGRQYQQSLSRHLQAVARPDTQVQTFGIDTTPFGKDRYHASYHRVLSLMIKSVLRAEPQGYDAIAVVNTFDHGYYELREIVDLPVVFITESTLYLACQLAPTFAFVTHNQAMLLHVTALAKRYGVAERMVRGHHLDLTYDDFPRMYANPAPYLATFSEAARQVIARGATILLVAGNPINMFLLDQRVHDVDETPILDCCSAVVKTAELMVDLHGMGIRRSPKGLFTAPPAEERMKLRKLYE
jgi:allantoin racemase